MARPDARSLLADLVVVLVGLPPRRVDDHLFARGVSAWSLDEAQATAAFEPITRGALAEACGARGWGAPRFRGCVERFVRDQAARTAGALDLGPRRPEGSPSEAAPAITAQ